MWVIKTHYLVCNILQPINWSFARNSTADCLISFMLFCNFVKSMLLFLMVLFETTTIITRFFVSVLLQVCC